MPMALWGQDSVSRAGDNGGMWRELSSPDHGQNAERGGLRFSENLSASVCRGSRRENIVDDDEVLILQEVCRDSKLHRFAQIGAALGTCESRLARSVLDPLEGHEGFEIELRGQGLGDFDRLIEATLPLSGGMEWHRNEQWVVEARQSFALAKCTCANLREVCPELGTPCQFELMNEVQGVVIGTQGGGREVKGKRQAFAVGTRLRRRDIAIKPLRASETSVCWQGAQASDAAAAEMTSLAERALTKGANRRIDPIEEARDCGWVAHARPGMGSSRSSFTPEAGSSGSR